MVRRLRIEGSHFERREAQASVRSRSVRSIGTLFPSSGTEAEALEADLLPLVGAGVITRLARHDTDPANNPQLPPWYRA